MPNAKKEKKKRFEISVVSHLEFSHSSLLSKQSEENVKQLGRSAELVRNVEGDKDGQ